ncbi:MAG: nitrogen regulation protein NR(II) [Planctomycetota bacterium]
MGLIDTLLGKDSADPSRVVRSFRRALTLISSPEQIRNHLLGTVRETFSAPRAALFELDEDANVFTPVASQGVGSPPAASFSFADKLVAWMNANRRHVDLVRDKGLWAMCGEDERSRWTSWGMEQVFPIMTLNRLTAFMVMGGRPLDGDSLELMRTLLNMGGVALHNALLHQRSQQVAESFHRAEKLALAGQLAAAAAHEIRNPLTSIRSSVQFVLGRLAEGDRSKAILSDVLGEVDRINGVVEGLLSSVRPKAPAYQRVDLIDLVGKVAAPFQRREGLKLTLDLDEKAREAVCDPDQIRQVLLNLLQNADQAMEGKGEIRVELRLEPTRSEKIRSVSALQTRVTVVDKGPGIKPSVIKKIFDPFFTTKAKNKGTGLGLSICRGIVEKHGGEMAVHSVEGQGASFEILLPVNTL